MWITHFKMKKKPWESTIDYKEYLKCRPTLQDSFLTVDELSVQGSETMDFISCKMWSLHFINTWEI